MASLLLPGDLLAGSSTVLTQKLSFAQQAAAAAEKNNLFVNPVASLATIASPASAPATTGFTNFLPAATGYAASFTGTTTAGSATITGVSSTAGLVVGQPLYQSGTASAYPANIPLGATLTSIVNATTITMSAQATASGSLTIKAASEKIELIGGVAGGYNGNFNIVAQHTTKATPQAGSPPYAIEFMTDAANVSTSAASLMIWSYRNGATPNAYKIAIDDVYQSALPQSFGDPNSGYITIQFATAGVHKVRVELPGISLLQDIYVLNGARIWKPARANALRACFFGDSYFEGGELTNNWGQANIAYRTAVMLGWLHDVNAQSGTGYIANGTTNYAWQEATRQADVAIRPYDIIVCLGSVNDSGQTAAAIQAAALTTWRGLRAKAPTAPMIIFGCPTTGNVNSTAAATIESGLSAAFTQWGDRNAFFIPITGDISGNWIDTSNIGAYIGSDNTHLTDIGCQYYASKMTQAIRALLNRIGAS